MLPGQRGQAAKQKMNRTSAAMRWLLVGAWVLSLPSCGGSSIRQLAAQLDDEDAQVRRSAASALANMRGSSSDLIAALSLASRSDDVEVREIAVEALGTKAGESDILFPALEQALADPELSVRLKAALAIYRFDPQNASYRPILLESLRAGHGTVFLEVGRMGQEAKWAMPALVTALSDPRPSIRALAARALGEIGVADDSVMSSIKLRLRDENGAVRAAAQKSLEQLTKPVESRP
jgi:HEAT repeat protein